MSFYSNPKFCDRAPQLSNNAHIMCPMTVILENGYLIEAGHPKKPVPRTYNTECFQKCMKQFHEHPSKPVEFEFYKCVFQCARKEIKENPRLR